MTLQLYANPIKIIKEKNIFVLKKQFWPADELQRALYGETEIVYLCKSFGLDTSLSSEIVLEYTLIVQAERFNGC